MSPIGGTTLESRGGGSAPLLAIIAAVLIAGGILAYVALRRGGTKQVTDNVPQQLDKQPAATPDLANPPPPPVPSAPTRAGPRPEAVAAELEGTLKRARLWATVTVIGDHVDVRSGSCADPQMKPTLDARASAFKAAGIGRLRCVEQGGSVVFDRGL